LFKTLEFYPIMLIYRPYRFADSEVVDTTDIVGRPVNRRRPALARNAEDGRRDKQVGIIFFPGLLTFPQDAADVVRVCRRSGKRRCPWGSLSD